MLFEPNSSSAYLEGYRAYQQWHQGDIDRPVNPYRCDSQDSNSQAEDWDKGWEDASFGD